MILNKFIAHCGLCSRRQAAEWVKAGKIKVNGAVEKNPAYRVQEKDDVVYEGKTLKVEEKLIYILLNKPKDYVTTLSDEKGRKTVIDLIKNQINQRVVPVGRLDRATTGLLVLTNDGALTHQLTHPKFGIKKAYQVELHTQVSGTDMTLIKRGLELEDGFIKVDHIEFKSEEEKERVEIILHSGRNRIIRRIFEYLGYKVKALDRMYFAGLTKKGLPRGNWRLLTEKEIRMLKHFTK